MPKFNSYQFKKLILELLSFFGIIGSRNIGTHASGNSILKLNKKSKLGHRGSKILIPLDNVIYKTVKYFGRWELDECHYLASALDIVEQSSEKITLVDVGANCGLTTLQVVNSRKMKPQIKKTKYIVVEPFSLHLAALRENLKPIPDKNLSIYPYALTQNQTGKIQLFTETNNFGNSSLLDEVVPRINRRVEIVETKTIKEFTHLYDLKQTNIVLKIDTQGLDWMLLSEFAKNLSENIMVVMVEVWAISSISISDLVNLREFISGFDYRSWTPFDSSRISIAEIFDFWSGKSEKTRNLYLSKFPITRI
jgi:FkbM family methyltransferase